MLNERPHLFGVSREELRELSGGWAMPAFRADQVLEWVYRKGQADPQAMTNLPAADRERLVRELGFLTGKPVRHQIATDGTQKLLIEWDAPAPAPAPGSGEAGARALPVMNTGAAQTECVMIPVDDAKKLRRTACISSQVGCAVGCRFCASGIGGLADDLSAGRIVEQVWRLERLAGVGRITNVVFMGMGEPLSNFGAVTKAVSILTAEWGMAISGRRITISTVGLPAQIRRLADLALPVTLAISLHAPNDVLRRELIPWADYVTIEQLLDAGRYYFAKTGREVTLEYILLGRVNDQAAHARELARVARTLRSNVNLIRYNEVPGLPYRRPAKENVLDFQKVLRAAGVNAHIRASRGRDIAAACGQLRRETAASPS